MHTLCKQIYKKKPYANTSEQNNILDQIVSTVRIMICTGKTVMQTFQKGICISTTAVKHLFQDLKNKYGIKYLLTHRLNEDVLENSFSQVNILINFLY